MLNLPFFNFLIIYFNVIPYFSITKYLKSAHVVPDAITLGNPGIFLFFLFFIILQSTSFRTFCLEGFKI